MTSIRAVIDTSSLISYVLTRGEIMRQVIGAWEMNEYQLLLSLETRNELFLVLDRPKIQKRAGRAKDWLLSKLDKHSVMIDGHLDFTGACRDPNDDMFLACAVEGRAHYLVSSDKDLLIMGCYEDVCILNPGQFLIALQLAKLSSEQIRTRFSSEALQTIRETVCLESETAAKLIT